MPVEQEGCSAFPTGERSLDGHDFLLGSYTLCEGMQLGESFLDGHQAPVQILVVYSDSIWSWTSS